MAPPPSSSGSTSASTVRTMAPSGNVTGAAAGCAPPAAHGGGCARSRRRLPADPAGGRQRPQTGPGPRGQHANRLAPTHASSLRAYPVASSRIPPGHPSRAAGNRGVTASFRRPRTPPDPSVAATRPHGRRGGASRGTYRGSRPVFKRRVLSSSAACLRVRRTARAVVRSSERELDPPIGPRMLPSRPPDRPCGYRSPEDRGRPARPSGSRRRSRGVRRVAVERRAGAAGRSSVQPRRAPLKASRSCRGLQRRCEMVVGWPQ